MNKNLIFDLGFHDGSDTWFYLNKGFKVVALEANPNLVEKGHIRFQNEIKAGQLTIVNCALSNQVGSIPFFVNDEKDDWSSTSEEWAQKGGHRTSQVQVKTINIAEMMEQFGHPFYIKCDIEGEDKTFIDQIVKAATKPKFLSVEGGGHYYISKLSDAGYTNFQLVNQLLHYKTEPPKPAREGQYFLAKFTNRMSGLFGKELRENRWWPSDKTIDALNKLREIRNIDPDLAPGWFDLHAMLETESE